MKAQKEVEELKQELDEIKSLLQKILSEQNK